MSLKPHGRSNPGIGTPACHGALNGAVILNEGTDLLFSGVRREQQVLRRFAPQDDACLARRKRVGAPAACLAAALLLFGTAHAQQAVPGLHQRPAQAQGEPAPQPTVATGHTDLPATAEGEYPWKSWRGDGQIELYFENGRLQGYMEEPQSAANQTGAPLTFDFTTTHVDGHALSFTTRTLHGGWYTFDGHLERGLAPDPSKSGYYRLTGTLTEHSGANAAPHTVSLPREPGTD